MKMPLSWHKKCLANAQRTAVICQEEAHRKTKEAGRIARHCIAYDAQIIEAETRGLTAFDRNKFGKKRIAKK